MDKIEAWIITIAIALTILAIPTKLFRLMVLTLICTSCTAMVWGAERTYPDEEIAQQKAWAKEPQHRVLVNILNREARQTAVAGDTIPISYLTEILYLDEPCQLPVVNAEHMRKYASPWFTSQGDGCWYETLGGGVTTFWSTGAGSAHQGVIGLYRHAILHAGPQTVTLQ